MDWLLFVGIWCIEYFSKFVKNITFFYFMNKITLFNCSWESNNLSKRIFLFFNLMFVLIKHLARVFSSGFVRLRLSSLALSRKTPHRPTTGRPTVGVRFGISTRRSRQSQFSFETSGVQSRGSQFRTPASDHHQYSQKRWILLANTTTEVQAKF